MRMTMPAMIAAIGLLTGAAPAPDQNFCERLAPQLDLKQVEIRRSTGVETEWRVNTASFGQHLVGGTVMTSVSVESAEGVAGDAAEYRRLAAMCGSTKKSLDCHVVGPAVLNMTTRRGVAKVVAQPGERATAGVRGTTVYCRLG